MEEKVRKGIRGRRRGPEDTIALATPVLHGEWLLPLLLQLCWDPACHTTSLDRFLQTGSFSCTHLTWFIPSPSTLFTIQFNSECLCWAPPRCQAPWEGRSTKVRIYSLPHSACLLSGMRRVTVKSEDSENYTNLWHLPRMRTKLDFSSLVTTRGAPFW